jgi:hypothetical protein
VRSASGLLLSLKSMAEVTADWLMSHAHQDGRPRMPLCSSPARLQCLSPKHCKQTIRVRRWPKRRMKANPPSQTGVDNPLPNSRRPDQSPQGYGKRWFEGLISPPRPIAIIKACASSAGPAGPRLDAPTRQEDPGCSSMEPCAWGATTRRRIAWPQLDRVMRRRPRKPGRARRGVAPEGGTGAEGL